MEAFDAGLAAKALAKVDSETADLFIGYQFAVGTEHKFESYRTESGYGVGWDPSGWHGVGTSTTDRSPLRRRSLVFPRISRARQKLVGTTELTR